MRSLAGAYELTGEGAHLSGGLLGLGWVALGTPACLKDERFGFVLVNFEAGDVAVELASVGPDELITFPNLGFC